LCYNSALIRVHSAISGNRNIIFKDSLLILGIISDTMIEQADTDDTDIEQQHNVSFQQNDEVDDASDGNNNDTTDINNDDKEDDVDNKPLEPLYHSTRLKGYTTLLVSALYNYLAAADKHNENKSLAETLESKFTNLCISLDDMGNLVERDYTNISRLRYAMACSMITM